MTTLETEIKQLQQELAIVDLITRPRVAALGDAMELLLVRLRELKVKMYQETGHGPHLHIDYGQHNHVASYSIHDPKRLAGTLDTKYDRAVLDWIAENRDKLLDIWKTMQSGTDPSGLIGDLVGDA
jgi:hypothetical protein